MAGETVKTKTNPAKRIIGIAVLLVILALVAGYTIYYLLAGQYLISTDDAYIAADSSLIAAKVSGYVTSVPVNDNQPVHQGDVLASIDPQDYQAALAAADASRQAAAAAIATAQAQLALQPSKIAQAKAALAADQARLSYAAQDQARFARLAGTGASPRQTADAASTSFATAQAATEADTAALATATGQTSVLTASLAQAQASLTQAQAAYAQAALNLSRTTIRAPFDGIIGNKTTAAGNYVAPGTELMALVPLTQIYVTANYKETQLTRILPGQPVTLMVDAYPDTKITGTVESIAPASGQEFALLPPDNATGNFTKIVQRIPIKITLTIPPALAGKLLPGMSVEPVIDTRPGG